MTAQCRWIFELAMLALDDTHGTAGRTHRDALRLDELPRNLTPESKEPAVAPVAEQAVTPGHVLNATFSPRYSIGAFDG
jgi:hypothetical protein